MSRRVPERTLVCERGWPRRESSVCRSSATSSLSATTCSASLRSCRVCAKAFEAAKHLSQSSQSIVNLSRISSTRTCSVFPQRPPRSAPRQWSVDVRQTLETISGRMKSLNFGALVAPRIAQAASQSQVSSCGRRDARPLTAESAVSRLPPARCRSLLCFSSCVSWPSRIPLKPLDVRTFKVSADRIPQ